MILRLALTATALLALSGPVLAQQAAPAARVAAAPAPVTEADIQAAGDAFGARMEALSQELGTAVAAANGNAARARTNTDPIVARYQPEADAFSALLTRFFAAMPEGPEKTQITAMAPIIEAEIKGAPGKIRDQALAGTRAP